MLRQHLKAIAGRLSSPDGRNIAAVAAAAERDSRMSKVFRERFVLTHCAESRVLLQRAVQAREIRHTADLDLVLDLLYGALFFHLLLDGAALDDRFVEAVFDRALYGLKP